jgi:deoxycitidine kinase/deoxyguanosine kinase
MFSIEGNIGSGKSLLLEHLRMNLSSSSSHDDPYIEIDGNKKRVCFVQEPVDIWCSIKDKDGDNMITKYYGDQKKYAFSFQMMAYISRLSLLKKAIREKYDIIITERSMFTDCNVFAKMLYDDGTIEDVNYIIYKKWFEEFLTELPEINVVYIKADPKIAHERIKKRDRMGEVIPFEYLENCHNYHESWLEKNESKMVINANIDNSLPENKSIYEKWTGDMKEYIISKTKLYVDRIEINN